MLKLKLIAACLFLTCLSFLVNGAEQSPAPTDGKTDLSSQGFGPKTDAPSTATTKQDEKKSDLTDGNDRKPSTGTTEGFGPNRSGNTGPAVKNTDGQKTANDTGSKTGAQSEGFGPNTGNATTTGANAGAAKDSGGSTGR